MGLIKIDAELCKGCELCVENCPQNAVGATKKINSKGYYVVEPVNEKECNGCSFCAIMCPEIAITVYK